MKQKTIIIITEGEGAPMFEFSVLINNKKTEYHSYELRNGFSFHDMMRDFINCYNKKYSSEKNHEHHQK